MAAEVPPRESAKAAANPRVGHSVSECPNHSANDPLLIGIDGPQVILNVTCVSLPNSRGVARKASLTGGSPAGRVMRLYSSIRLAI